MPQFFIRGTEVDKKTQNFRLISPKLCLLGQKKDRDMGCEYHCNRVKLFNPISNP